MNYDKLYEKDYIQHVPDEACAPLMEDEFYCDVHFVDNRDDTNGYTEERCYYDSARDLIKDIADGLREQGYPLNKELVKKCIKRQDLETFFGAIHFIFDAAGFKHWIEFRQFTEEEVERLQRNSESFVYCYECEYRNDCDYAQHKDNDKDAGCIDGKIDYENEDKYGYEYWRDNVMDSRLEYLDADEKYEMYLSWYNEQKKEN